VANTNRSFSQYEEWKSEMNASDKRACCKVARMLMELFGYCFFEQSVQSSVCGGLRSAR
jgi:hypothetical protein